MHLSAVVGGCNQSLTGRSELLAGGKSRMAKRLFSPPFMNYAFENNV